MDRRKNYGQRTNERIKSGWRTSAEYYAHGSYAAKVDEKRDEVSLKYYGKLRRIENRSAITGSILKIACAFVICTCAIAIIFARSKVYNYQLENSRLSLELDTAKEKTISIIAQSTEKVELAHIEAEAARLNMAKPQSYQIVYIEVPKTDYTVMLNPQTVIEKEKKELVSYKDVVSGLKETKDFLIGNKGETAD